MTNGEWVDGLLNKVAKRHLGTALRAFGGAILAGVGISIVMDSIYEGGKMEMALNTLEAIKNTEGFANSEHVD